VATKKKKSPIRKTPKTKPGKKKKTPVKKKAVTPRKKPARPKKKTAKKTSRKKPVKKRGAPKKAVQKKKTPAKKATPKHAKKTSRKKAVKKRTAPKKAVQKKKTPAKKATQKPAKKTKTITKKKISPVKKGVPKHLDTLVFKIRARLLKERSELLAMIRSSQEVERNVGDITFSNEIDLASSLEGREMAFQLSSRERNELRLIEDALFKITSGNYGMCEGCSKIIGAKRLQILPLTSLCIQCQENLEVS